MVDILSCIISCFLILQVARPKSLCKDTIQTRNRKSKNDPTNSTGSSNKKAKTTAANKKLLATSECLSPVINMLSSSTGGTPNMGGLLNYDDIAHSTTSTYPTSCYNTTSTSNIFQYGGQPVPCTSYNTSYLSNQESKLHDMNMSSQQSSPPNYYSPPSTMQLPVEGTITTADCHYNYYNYGVSPSPSHPHPSPISSHHSSPIIHNTSSPIHSSVPPAAIHSPLM